MSVNLNEENLEKSTKKEERLKELAKCSNSILTNNSCARILSSLSGTSPNSSDNFNGASSMRGGVMNTNLPSLNQLRQSGSQINLNSSLQFHQSLTGGNMSGGSNSNGMWSSAMCNTNSNNSNGPSIGQGGSVSYPIWGEMADSLLERGRSKNWTYEETMELINTYTSDEWQNKFSSEKKNHRAIWSEMAEVLKKREGVTGDEARQRLNNLKALYNRIRRQLIAGEIAAPQWEYWDSLHSFLTRPSQYSSFGFPREGASPLRSGLSPPSHSGSTPPYSSMQHMSHLPRPFLHNRMGPPSHHMMHHHISSPQLHHMSPRPHEVSLSMPHFPSYNKVPS